MMSPFHAAQEIANLYDFETLKELIPKAETAYEVKDGMAVAIAKSIIELICKEIVKERADGKAERDFHKLVQQSLRLIGCNDNQIVGGLTTAALAMATFRNNRVPEAHGISGNQAPPEPIEIQTHILGARHILEIIHSHLVAKPSLLKTSRLPFEQAEEVHGLKHINAYIDLNATAEHDEETGLLSISGKNVSKTRILYEFHKDQYQSDVEDTKRVFDNMIHEQATDLINEELTNNRFDNFFPGHYGYEFPEIWINKILGDRDGEGEIICNGSVSTTATMMSSKDGYDLDYSSGFTASLTIHRAEDGTPQLELNELSLERNDWWPHEEDAKAMLAAQAEPEPAPMAEATPTQAALVPLVQISPNLPSARNLSGTCWIYIPETGETEYTLGQQEILKLLWPCHGEEANEKRKFIIDQNDEKFTIGLPNTRMFLTPDTCREFCASVDSMIPAYLSALKQLEHDLDAEGFYFDTLHNSDDIILGEVTAELWGAMHEFISKHDYESGDTPWHIFDSRTSGIKVYHKTSTDRFDRGFQAIIDISEVHRDSMRAPHTPGDVELRWNPRLNLDGVSPGKRANWSPTTIVAWLTDEFIPVVKEEYGLSDYHDFTDYREWNKCELSQTPTDEDLIKAVDFIQSRYNSISTDDLFHVQPHLAQEVMKHLVLFLEKGNLPSLNYISDKLLSRRAHSIKEMIAAIQSLSDEIGTEPRDASWIDHLFRALGEALERGKPDLTEEERQSFTQALEPFIKQLDELSVVKRHLREFY